MGASQCSHSSGKTWWMTLNYGHESRGECHLLHQTCWEIVGNSEQLHSALTMLNLECILQNDRLMRAMTGLN
jgi:hypothetical protein